MAKFIIIAIIALLITFPALAQTKPPPKPPLTDREQVKADRAKAAEDDKTAPTSRPWDRDTDGRRPWDPKPLKPEGSGLHSP